ncbi:MAG: hydrogenase [Nitrospirales bacterium]
MPTIPVNLGSYMVNLCSALLLLTCFAIVAQRRLMACVDLFALQSVFLAVTATLVAYLTDIHHIYVAAVLTIAIKAIILPRILKKIVRTLNVQREVTSYVNIPAGLLICGALIILAFFITQPISHLGFLLTQDSLAIALGIVLIGFFIMITRQKAVTQVIGFLVMENGLFLAATAAAYGMPLIVELGIFFDVLVAGLIVGIYTNQIQGAFGSVDTARMKALKE